MRFQTASRHSRRVAEELMPRRFTPRRMKGITVVLSSALPAMPMLAMLPQKSTLRVSQASTSPPTLSMAPAKRAFSSGREPSSRSWRVSTSAAPSSFRYSPAAALPLTATTR